MVRITRISPGAASKVCGYIFALYGFLSCLPLFFISLVSAEGVGGEPGRLAATLTLMASPFLGAIAGLIGGAIVAWFYNYTVKYTGGLVFETDEKRGFSSIREGREVPLVPRLRPRDAMSLRLCLIFEPWFKRRQSRQDSSSPGRAWNVG